MRLPVFAIIHWPAKTRNHQQHTLPLSDYLHELLTRRNKFSVNEYVFPGNGVDGHLIEPKRQTASVIEETRIINGIETKTNVISPKKVV